MNLDFNAIVSEEARLRAALEGADTVPLIMALVHLTGDDSLLDQLRPHVRGPWDYSQSIPDADGRRVREALVTALKALATGTRKMPPMPDRALLTKMMSVSTGQIVPNEYVPMMLGQMALDDDSVGARARRLPSEVVQGSFHVAIIGAGMSGLCLAIKLKQEGIPFTIFEKNTNVGGTWFENSYPGCGVDTPNHFYSFSFEPNHEWTEFYSKRNELWSYFRRCAEQYDLNRHIRFETELTAARFDEQSARWTLELRESNETTETFVANALIGAVGQLNRPSIPDIPGRETFAGPAFHTSRWNHAVDLKGQRVGMIGTGASGMQVGPSIAGIVDHLTIFQRSPHWAVANPNYHRAVSDQKKWVLQNIPFYRHWYRFQLFWGFSDGIHAALQVDPEWPKPDTALNAINERHRINMVKHIERELFDRPDLIEKVTPRYPPYGKRMLMDNHWYQMLRRPNVDLVTQPIDCITADGVVTVDGAQYPLDVIVFATGFQAGRMLSPINLVGRDGAVLQELWRDDNPRAYLGITVPGFPNLFLLYGPNTNLGHGGSAIFHTECQVNYTLQCLRAMIEQGWSKLECRQEVHDAYNERVDRAHERMIWAHKGVGNWYRNRAGRVFANSPWRLVDYWRMTSKPDFDEYLVA